MNTHIIDRANYIVARRLERINRMVAAGILTETQADELLRDVDWVRLAGAVLEDLKNGNPVPTRT